MTDVCIFIGLQGAGKSTFCQSHFAETYVCISKDKLKSSKSAHKAVQQASRLEEALKAGRSVVIDNTNPTKEDRYSIIHAAHLYKANVIGYYFDASVKSCIERNRERTGKAQVPDKVIYITAKRMVVPVYDEGFDKLYIVHTEAHGKFKVVTIETNIS